jgi:hypothetical protein
VCLVHVPVGGSSGSWQGAATSSSRVITPWSWLGPTAKSQHGLSCAAIMDGTEAVPVLRSQVPNALLGARPQADGALGRDPQVPVQRRCSSCFVLRELTRRVPVPCLQQHRSRLCFAFVVGYFCASRCISQTTISFSTTTQAFSPPACQPSSPPFSPVASRYRPGVASPVRQSHVAAP